MGVENGMIKYITRVLKNKNKHFLWDLYRTFILISVSCFGDQVLSIIIWDQIFLGFLVMNVEETVC